MVESTNALLSDCNQAIERARRILKGDRRALSGFGTLRDRVLGVRTFAFQCNHEEGIELAASLDFGLNRSWPDEKLANRITADLERLVARLKILSAIRDSEEAQCNALLSPVVPKAETAPTDPWARFAGRSATKEDFLRLVNVYPRDFRDMEARAKKVKWSIYVANKIVPTHKATKKGQPSLYPVRDLCVEFERLAWSVKPLSAIDAIERLTVPSGAPRRGYTLNRRN